MKQKDWGIVKYQRLTIPPSKLRFATSLCTREAFLSYTVTSRENVYQIFHLLGEPKTLDLDNQWLTKLN